MSHDKFKFLVSTPDDRGSHSSQIGISQRIKSHTSFVTHARKRAVQFTDGSFQQSASSITHFQSNLPTESAGLPRIRRGFVKAKNVSAVPDHKSLEFIIDFSGDAKSPRIRKSSASRALKDLAARQSPLSSSPSLSLGQYLHLPIELTTEEQNKFQFYLTQGRHKMSGCADPVYDVTVAAALRQMQFSPVFVLARISIMTNILNSSKETSPTPEHYRSVARSYHVTSDILSSERSNLASKISAMLNLQAMESMRGRKDLQKVHALATRQIMGPDYLLALLNDDKVDKFTIWDLVYVMGHLAWGDDFSESDLDDFDRVVSSFLDNLQNYQHWISSTTTLDECKERDSLLNTPNFDAIVEASTLRPLVDYLQHIIEAFIASRNEHLFGKRAAAMNLLVNMCTTLSVLNCTKDEVVQFLHLIQLYILYSISPPPSSGVKKVDRTADVTVLHPSHVYGSLFYVRRGLSLGVIPAFERSTCIQQEVMISLAAQNTARLMATFSQVTILRLARSIVFSILCVAQGISTACFDSAELSALRLELAYAREKLRQDRSN